MTSARLLRTFAIFCALLVPVNVAAAVFVGVWPIGVFNLVAAACAAYAALHARRVLRRTT